MSWKRALLGLARRTRLLRAVGAAYGRNRLTVLAYHRVIDHSSPGFDTLRRNVSATPEAFAGQMRAVAGYYSPVSLREVVAWLDGGPQLPARPLLVTFDDGYRDNLEFALPILREHDIPATVFLASDHIGTREPFWWDLAAWCMMHTPLETADLPGLGSRSWDGDGERDRVLGRWTQALKLLPQAEREAAMAEAAGALEVEVAADAFDGLLLSWDEVRGMRDAGVEFGAHTKRHPILTRVDPDRAREEIVESKLRVEEETGVSVLGFAYPNGRPGDYTAETKQMVAAAGYRLAVTLSPGPARPAEVRRDPLAVRRVTVHHRDHPSRFAAKIMGLGRIFKGLQ